MIKRLITNAPRLSSSSLIKKLEDLEDLEYNDIVKEFLKIYKDLLTKNINLYHLDVMDTICAAFINDDRKQYKDIIKYLLNNGSDITDAFLAALALDSFKDYQLDYIILILSYKPRIDNSVLIVLSSYIKKICICVETHRFFIKKCLKMLKILKEILLYISVNISIKLNKNLLENIFTELHILTHQFTKDTDPLFEIVNECKLIIKYIYDQYEELEEKISIDDLKKQTITMREISQTVDPEDEKLDFYIKILDCNNPKHTKEYLILLRLLANEQQHYFKNFYPWNSDHCNKNFSSILNKYNNVGYDYPYVTNYQYSYVAYRKVNDQYEILGWMNVVHQKIKDHYGASYIPYISTRGHNQSVKGVGTALLNRFIRECKKLKIPSFFLKPALGVEDFYINKFKMVYDQRQRIYLKLDISGGRKKTAK